MNESEPYYQFERSDWDAPYSPLNRVGRYQHYQIMRVLSFALKRTDFRLSVSRSILDVGCGQGAWLNMLADIRGSADGLYGIDLMPDRLDFAKRINPSIDFVEGDMRSLPYEDNQFDLVTTFASLMFLPNERELAQALSEMSRVLRPGGRLFLLEPSKAGHTAHTRGITEADIRDAIKGSTIDYGFSLPYFRKLGVYSTASLVRKLPEWICLLIDSCEFLPAANYLYALESK